MGLPLSYSPFKWPRNHRGGEVCKALRCRWLPTEGLDQGIPDDRGQGFAGTATRLKLGIELGREPKRDAVLLRHRLGDGVVDYDDSRRCTLAVQSCEKSQNGMLSTALARRRCLRSIAEMGEGSAP